MASVHGFVYELLHHAVALLVFFLRIPYKLVCKQQCHVPAPAVLFLDLDVKIYELLHHFLAFFLQNLVQRKVGVNVVDYTILLIFINQADALQGLLFDFFFSPWLDEYNMLKIRA